MSHLMGYDAKLVKPLSEGYRCPYCNLVMCDPIQTIFGERACGTCYAAMGVDNEDGNQVFKDRLAQREINNLECYCYNQEGGCKWIGTLLQLQEHKVVCDFITVRCNLCRNDVLRNELHEHKENSCTGRTVVCSYCGENCTASKLSEHEKYCLKKPTMYQFGCGKEISIDQFRDHALNDCENVRKGVICPYKLVGCEYAVNGKEELLEHESYALVNHCIMFLPLIENEKTCIVLNERMPFMDRRIVIENEFVDIKNQIDIIRTELNRQISQLNEVIEECKTLSAQNWKKTDDLTSFENVNDASEALEVVNEKISNPQQLQELDGLVNEKSSVNAMMTFTTLQNKVKETEKEVDKIERNNAVMSASMADLDTKVQLLEVSSLDGHQIWRISDVRLRIENAMTGKATAIHSPPCYTHRGGYKFSTRVYLNGDGMGKGSHISVFFVLMKSDYDNLLEWPFQKKVSFRLLNAKDSKLSHRETFNPDRTSSSFQKPTKEMNIAAGFPMFVRLDRLHSQNFIIDDCIFIETTVL